MSPTHSQQTRPSISESSRWVVIGAALAKPLQLVANVYLARVLTPVGFGVLGLANTTAVTVGGIAGLGLGEAANRFMGENFYRDRTTATRIAAFLVATSLLLGSLVVCVTWLTRDIWTSWVFSAPPGEMIVTLCLLLGFANLIYSLAVNLLTGIQAFRVVAMLGAMQALLVVAISLPLAKLAGVSGALAGSVLASLVCVAWSAAQLRRIDAKLLAAPRALSKALLSELFHFSVPSWLALFVINPVNLFVFSLLASQGGVAEVGQFNTANGFKMVVAMLPGLIGTAIGPAIAEEAGRHGKADSLERLLDNAFAAIAFLTIPFAVLLTFLSDIVFLIYGKAYSASYLIFMPLTTGVVAMLLSAPLQMVLVAKNRAWVLLAATLLKALALLALALLWVPTEHSSGLSWAMSAAEVIYAIVVVECCVRPGHATRTAATFFYQYLTMTLGALALALALPAQWRWWLAIPLASAAALLIIRRHPEIVIWISGVLPAAIREPARRALAYVAGNK